MTGDLRALCEPYEELELLTYTRDLTLMPRIILLF